MRPPVSRNPAGVKVTLGGSVSLKGPSVQCLRTAGSRSPGAGALKNLDPIEAQASTRVCVLRHWGVGRWGARGAVAGPQSGSLRAAQTHLWAGQGPRHLRSRAWPVEGSRGTRRAPVPSRTCLVQVSRLVRSPQPQGCVCVCVWGAFGRGRGTHAGVEQICPRRQLLPLPGPPFPW